jgi:hypothetical protein
MAKRSGKRRDPVREKYWRRTIQDQQRSGLAVRAFCLREGLKDCIRHRPSPGEAVMSRHLVTFPKTVLGSSRQMRRNAAFSRALQSRIDYPFSTT